MFSEGGVAHFLDTLLNILLNGTGHGCSSTSRGNEMISHCLAALGDNLILEDLFVVLKPGQFPDHACTAGQGEAIAGLFQENKQNVELIVGVANGDRPTEEAGVGNAVSDGILQGLVFHIEVDRVYLTTAGHPNQDGGWVLVGHVQTRRRNFLRGELADTAGQEEAGEQPDESELGGIGLHGIKGRWVGGIGKGSILRLGMAGQRAASLAHARWCWQQRRRPPVVCGQRSSDQA